ncbi:MAG: 1-deoxy-D-xylulose-5-phosphate reductoisomerase [Planctomycetota bacterium]|jgi:1-deoxy-D-xylulose-5-phosphate reductoisomerase|nr:1-deoxy-D-xylulose-5-phosphate reductoisomerase [Planctomycetota bacterium]
MKDIIILGATGSIGSKVLAVIRAHPGEFRVAGLAAGRDRKKLAALGREFPEASLALGSSEAENGRESLGPSPGGGRFYSGPDGLLRLLAETPAEVCVAAIGGTAGLEPTFSAVSRGARLLLANKEVLVSAGRLFLAAAREGGSEILPIDSEHCAVWQCLEGRDNAEVANITLTASGGPFRDWPAERLERATPEEAVRHPIWSMGKKISVDSATLANKALEVIEAHHLFNLPFEAIRVLVHPQSLVHGLVEFVDGTQLACLGISDMRQPISRMLFHPRRLDGGLPRLDLAAGGGLDFAPPDPERFPLLPAGIRAGQGGDRSAAFFNAANEAAVKLFLARRLSFPGIARAVVDAMRESEGGDFTRLAEIGETHERAGRLVAKLAESSP